MKNLILILFLSILASCSKEKTTTTTPVQPTKDSVAVVPNSTENLSKEAIIKTLNTEILQLLKSKNYNQFDEFIHPEKGVRFSMYAFVQPETDKKFSREEFKKYIDTPVKFTWGEKDGTGDPLVLSMKNYLQSWVFKKDFTNSEYSIDKTQATGNSLNNLKKVYPNAIYTENYIKGTEEYSEMDWRTLRLVFEEFQGKYYVVGVINDEWTI